MSPTTPPALRLRRHKPRVSSLQAALIGAVVVALACYFVFGGGLPFSSSPFELKAVFTANTELHIPSPVRIAGVQVGEVTGVERLKGSPNAGIVVMQIDKSGLPIHADATADIRSRIFLEGNFYVDLQPGTPESPILNSGATLPAANTSGPVQLDRVLSALNSSARGNLQKLVQGLGAALNTEPTASQNAAQDPAVRGMTAAQALNYSLGYSAKAFEASALVNQALLGKQPHDLSGVIKGESKVFTALDDAGNALPNLIDNFDTTMTALADDRVALGQAVATLPTLLTAAESADHSLQASFAPTQQFASLLTPSIKQLARTITVTLPWLKDMTTLSSSSYLGGLLKYLTPSVQNAAKALKGTTSLVSEADLLSKCFTNVIIPTGNETITEDPSTGNTLQDYQELFQSAVGLAGATANFDGNGHYTQVTVGGGSDQVQTQSYPGIGPFYGNAVAPPEGDLPSFPSTGTAPTLNASAACFTQTAPNLNSSTVGTEP